MKKKTKLITGITSFFVSIVGHWLIDISISAILMGGTLTNGIWTLNPTIGYHIGLWLSVASAAITTLILAE